jgi:hypothetical protein
MNLVSLFLGKLRMVSHRCDSWLPVRRKATMLSQLAFLASNRVALAVFLVSFDFTRLAIPQVFTTC